MTLFFVLPQSFDLCLLCHAFDGMRREPNRSRDDMKSTWGFYKGAYTCWVAIVWMRVQNPEVIGSVYFDDFFLRANKNKRVKIMVGFGKVFKKNVCFYSCLPFIPPFISAVYI